MQRSSKLHWGILAGALALTGWSSRPALAQVTPTATGLPPGFFAVGLGKTNTDAQSVAVANGVFTIKAGGAGLGAAADGGAGIYQERLSSGSVVAHLLTQGDTNAQNAVVFREATDQGARVVRLTYSGANLAQPSFRKTVDAASQQPNTTPGILGLNGKGTGNFPPAGRALGSGIWIGIDRVDDVFGFFTSNDGKVWNKIGGASIPGFAFDAFVGIEASKGTATAVQTSTLDNVSVSNDLIAAHAVKSVGYTPLDKAVIVTWSPTGDAGVTYNLYSYTKPDASDAKMIQGSIKSSSTMVDGLTNGTAYRFGVTAVLNGVETALQVPEPTYAAENTAKGSTGIAVPFAPILGGFTLFNIGTDSPGSVTVTGVGLAGAAIHMKASGHDLWEAGDGGSYLAVPIAGDLDISARFLKGPTNTDDSGGWSQGGPMFRESLDAGSRMVVALLSRTNGMQFKRRRLAYQQPTNTGKAVTDNSNPSNVTLRLIRIGDTFQAFYSEDDGATWQDMGDPSATSLTATSRDTISGFSKMPYVGIVLTALKEGAYTEADIDRIVIRRPF